MQLVYVPNASRCLALETQGRIHVKHDGPDVGHIGLRETPDAAFERAVKFYDRVTKETHRL